MSEILNETENLRQLSDEEMEQLVEELNSLRTDNEKMRKMLSTIEKMNELLTIQLSKCQCNQLFDTKLNTKLNVLKTKYLELKDEIDISLNNRLNTDMILIKTNDNTQQIHESLAEHHLNQFYSEDNNEDINSNNSNNSNDSNVCVNEEIVTKNSKTEDKRNIVYMNINDINVNKSMGNEINLCHNYAEVDDNCSDNDCGEEEEEEDDECEYSCEYADKKTGLLCEKKFTNQESLLNHVIGHTGERPWFCDWPNCQYKAVQRNHLVGHMRKSHTGRFQFKCDWPGCDFKGPSRYNVKRHRIIHTGEKPYKCDWPGCDFRSPNNKIAAHKRIHTGERPYACNWVGCEARFSRPFTLRNHERTHTGEKPFACDYPNCQYRSTQQTPLATHKRKHHSLGNVASEEVIITENVIIGDD